MLTKVKNNLKIFLYMFTLVNDTKSYRFVINRFKMPKDRKLNDDIPTINITFSSYIFSTGLCKISTGRLQ